MSFYSHDELSSYFDANKAANVRSKEAGATAISLLNTYMSGYEKFWQTPRTHADRALSMEEVQAMISAAPAAMTEILADGAAFVSFVQSTYPEKVGTDIFPSRYLTSPYNMTEEGVLIDLKPEWDVQENNE